MATKPKNIYLGAPDSIILDYNTAAQVDLGATQGGVTVHYKPTVALAEIDQSLGPVAVWKTKEEATVEMSLAQQEVPKFLAAMSVNPAGDTLTSASTLTTIGTVPALVVNGTGAATSYSYEVFAFTAQGDGIPSTAVTTAAGPATLTSVNSITVTLPALPAGAIGFGVIRTVGGASQGLLFRLAGNATSITDTGYAATTYVASATQPATNATDSGTIGGTVAASVHQLDIAVPLNNGAATSPHIRYRFPKAYFNGDIQLDYKREKETVYKVVLGVLADPTLAVGQQFFTFSIES